MKERMVKWCPANGCGKCIVYLGKFQGYYCSRCKSTWKNKKELIKADRESK